MSARSKIVEALAEKLKDINGTSVYESNLFNNVYNKLKFWNESMIILQSILVQAQSQENISQESLSGAIYL